MHAKVRKFPILKRGFVYNKNRLCSMTCGIDKNKKNITKEKKKIKNKKVCTIFF